MALPKGTYYPRYALHISVPVLGSASEKTQQEDSTKVVDWTMPLTHFRWEKNDHNQADVLEVGADWSVAGLDPRMLTDATGALFVANATDPFNWEPGPDNLRFVGVMIKPARRASEEAMATRLTFHDYTRLFIDEKPFVSAGIPDYSQKLSEAWARICDHVGPTDESGKPISVVKTLRDAIVFKGGATDVVLGKAVASRFKKDKIPVKHDGSIDAWAVWQRCVRMCGLISYIDRDQVVVTTSTGYWTENEAPRLIWGRNVLELEEERDTRRTREGVIIASFDPMTGTTIEGYYPPIGDQRIKAKHLTKKKQGNADAILNAESRQTYYYEGVTDPQVLTDIAQSVYEERSRQELAGMVTTSEMLVEAADGSTFDLMTLASGQVVRVEIERDTLAQVLGAALSGAGEEYRVNLLVAQGYDEGVARILVKNLDAYGALSPNFFTKNVIVESDSESMTFQITVHYCNRIDPVGNATAT